MLPVTLYSKLALQSSAEHLNNPSQLGEAQYFLVGEITDVNLSHEGDEMMLAEREHFDVSHNDHFVVVLVKDSLVKNC